YPKMVWSRRTFFGLIISSGNPMTPAQFRKLALGIPDAVESAHMGHPDFRVNGKIFATLGYPDETSGMVKLSPEEQALFIEKAPGVFHPCNGAWGRQGATNVALAAATGQT